MEPIIEYCIFTQAIENCQLSVSADAFLSLHLYWQQFSHLIFQSLIHVLTPASALNPHVGFHVGICNHIWLSPIDTHMLHTLMLFMVTSGVRSNSVNWAHSHVVVVWWAGVEVITRCWMAAGNWPWLPEWHRSSPYSQKQIAWPGTVVHPHRLLLCKYCADNVPSVTLVKRNW